MRRTRPAPRAAASGERARSAQARTGRVAVGVPSGVGFAGSSVHPDTASAERERGRGQRANGTLCDTAATPKNVDPSAATNRTRLLQPTHDPRRRKPRAQICGQRATCTEGQVTPRNGVRKEPAAGEVPVLGAPGPRSRDDSDMEQDGVGRRARRTRSASTRPGPSTRSSRRGGRRPAVLGGAAPGRRQDAGRPGDRAAPARTTVVLGPNTAIQSQWLRGWDGAHRRAGRRDAGPRQAVHGADLPVAGHVRARRRGRRGRRGEPRLLDRLHPNGRALVERLKAVGDLTLVLDECHHLLEVWGRLLQEVLDELPDAFVLGLTATPPGTLTRRPEGARRRAVRRLGVQRQHPGRRPRGRPGAVRRAGLADHPDRRPRTTGSPRRASGSPS